MSKCGLLCCVGCILVVGVACNWDHHHQGSIYRFHSSISDRRDYSAAQHACAQENATLASINSEAENTYLTGEYGYGRFWIGLVCPPGPNCSLSDLIWADGSNVEFTNGIVSIPSNTGVAIDARNGHWRLIQATDEHRRYICEKEDPCWNNPCHNEGTCELTVSGDFMCYCLEGTSGTTCDNTYNECNTDPCQNGGTCTHCATEASRNNDADSNDSHTFNDASIAVIVVGSAVMVASLVIGLLIVGYFRKRKTCRLEKEQRPTYASGNSGGGTELHDVTIDGHTSTDHRTSSTYENIAVPSAVPIETEASGNDVCSVYEAPVCCFADRDKETANRSAPDSYTYESLVF